jgi:hypothetical protein
MDWHFQGPGHGVTKSAYIFCGIGVGAFGGAVWAAAINGSPVAIYFGAIAGALLGAIIGWLLGSDSQSDKANTRKASVGARPHADYPRWLVTLFPVSLGAFMIGLLSALYIALAGFSTIALAGTYLIPLGLMALYYLLGAAERRASQ